MSLTRELNLKCTECGAENVFTVYDSVNVTLNPELKEKVLSGELFKMECDACDALAVINYDILYHDMSEYRPLLIQCTHQKDGWEKINGGNTKIRKMMNDMNLSTAFPHRTVIGYNALRETIRIFDAGYDDRIMFVVKKMFATLLQRDGVPCRGILFCGCDENRAPVFSVLDTENNENFYTMPFESCDHIAEKFQRILPPETEEYILVDDAYMDPYIRKI